MSFGPLTHRTLLTVLTVGPEGDFDGDLDIDGNDLLAWQRNPSVGSLADWQTQYGNGASHGTLATVTPEPGTAALTVVGLVFAVSGLTHARPTGRGDSAGG